MEPVLQGARWRRHSKPVLSSWMKVGRHTTFIVAEVTRRGRAARYPKSTYIQRAYRACLAAAGKVVRIVDAGAVDAALGLTALHAQLTNALSKFALREEKLTRLRDRKRLSRIGVEVPGAASHQRAEGRYHAQATTVSASAPWMTAQATRDFAWRDLRLRDRGNDS